MRYRIVTSDRSSPDRALVAVIDNDGQVMCIATLAGALDWLSDLLTPPITITDEQ